MYLNYENLAEIAMWVTNKFLLRFKRFAANTSLLHRVRYRTGVILSYGVLNLAEWLRSYKKNGGAGRLFSGFRGGFSGITPR